MKHSLLILVAALVFFGMIPDTLRADDTALKQALELDRQNFVAESIPLWQEFLKSQPEKNRSIYARIKLTHAYSHIGNFGEAVKSARALAAVYPDHYDVQFNLGNALSATHQFTEAVQAFRKATVLRKDEGLAFVGLGLSLFGDRKPDESVQVLREVRKLFKQQKNISWYQHVRIMIGQIKGFAPYPPDFSDLWLANNLKKVRQTYESSVFKAFEKELGL